MTEYRIKKSLSGDLGFFYQDNHVGTLRPMGNEYMIFMKKSDGKMKNLGTVNDRNRGLEVIKKQHQKTLTAFNVAASQRSRRDEHFEKGTKPYDKEFDAFYAEIKKDPAIRKVIRPENWEWDIFTDCYYTARSAGQSNRAAQRFAKAMFWDYVKNGRKNDITDPQLKAVHNKIKSRADRNFESEGKAFLRYKKRKGENMDDFQMESSDTSSYTNKSKNVKLIFFKNRSTCQTVKPGQTVKHKAGYGPRTKVRNATPEEVKQLQKGVWLRTREDNKKPNEKGAKTSKYRPWLTGSAAAENRLKRMGLL